MYSYLQLRSLLHLPNGELLVSQLSGGTQRRVSLAIAMINSPTIVILDEPTVGIDPVVRQKIWSFLVEECKRGLTTVIVTHYVEEAATADRVGLMRNGRILAEDSPTRLMQMFDTNSLEDVFLQLCLIEDRSMKEKGVCFYKNQNSQSHLSSSFNPDSYLDNMKDDNSWAKPLLNLWILMILIHKNILKFANMNISLLIILLPAIQGIIFCTVYSKELIEVSVISKCRSNHLILCFFSLVEDSGGYRRKGLRKLWLKTFVISGQLQPTYSPTRKLLVHFQGYKGGEGHKNNSSHSYTETFHGCDR